MLHMIRNLLYVIRNISIYYSKCAKDRYHKNANQKKFENMYLIIDSSDINSLFRIQLQNE